MNACYPTSHGVPANVVGLVERAWADHRSLAAPEAPVHAAPVHAALDVALDLLDEGVIRIADKVDGEWQVNEWLMQALILRDQCQDYALVEGAAGNSCWWDKDTPKFAGWGEREFRAAGFRAMPGCVVRRTAHIARNVILNPCFVSWGARIDEGSTIDTWVTVGSCAQVGRNVHVSAGVCLGGVLEPRQTRPVIVEDDCFIGAQCSIVEGVIVGEGSVIGAGTVLSASTKIVDRATGEVHLGRVPPHSVVVPGSLPGRPLPDGSPGPSLNCAVITKRVDDRTRARTCVNDLFRPGALPGAGGAGPRRDDALAQ